MGVRRSADALDPAGLAALQRGVRPRLLDP